MNNKARITAIMGSYRRGGVIDRAIEVILESAGAEGAETAKVSLIDEHIEFCTNCRSCTQKEGKERGECVIDDGMHGILDRIKSSDAIVFGAPMNFGTVTAVTKRFIERLVCFAYWPWGMPAPKVRDTHKSKRAVIVISSAAPALLARLTTKMLGLMKYAAGILGAETIGVLFIGLAAGQQMQPLSKRNVKKARRLGKKLAALK
ncbi:MAG: NAD(P)H-dependent oxidoreductase [Verrucomicrobia bacterium]|nr:NAD(P)H-dependent oxidoreductase [Verrucomicrobiota bacterium]